MNRILNFLDLSYYKLSLMDFLRESHPERLNDDRFISARSEAAADIYAQAVRNGSNDTEADNLAHRALFENLYFSKHDTLVNILWNEFSNDVPEDDAKEMAMKLLLECESVFPNILFQTILPTILNMNFFTRN